MNRKGFTLLELMVVVMIISVLAAVAIPMLGKYMKRAKTTEALFNVRKIYDGEVSYYDEDHTSSTGKLFSKSFIVQFPTPPFPPTNQKRYGNFETGGWPAVRFSPDGAVFYSYMVDTVNNTAPIPQPVGVPQLPDPDPSWVDAFVVRAMGDIDGDGVFSMFERLGLVKQGVDGVTGSSAIFQWDELE